VRAIQDIDTDINDARKRLESAREDVRRLEGERTSCLEQQATHVGQKVLALKTDEERMQYLKSLGAGVELGGPGTTTTVVVPVESPDDEEARLQRIAEDAKRVADAEARLAAEAAEAKRRQDATADAMRLDPVVVTAPVPVESFDDEEARLKRLDEAEAST
jgi:hypothetical protein